MKKDNAAIQLVGFMRDQKLEKGDKIPPERELAEILNTSRSTVREALRLLEGRGVLTIKRSSGIFLNKPADAIDPGNRPREIDENTLIRDQLEAYLMIFPLMVRCAAARANDAEIKALQNCIVTMSRAIVAKELEPLKEADSEFHRLLAIMTRNHRLLAIMEELNVGRGIIWEYLIKHDQFVNSVIFSGYVEMVNALKNKESDEAAERAKRNIIQACQQISRIKNINFCEFLEKK